MSEKRSSQVKSSLPLHPFSSTLSTGLNLYQYDKGQPFYSNFSQLIPPGDFIKRNTKLPPLIKRSEIENKTTEDKIKSMIFYAFSDKKPNQSTDTSKLYLEKHDSPKLSSSSSSSSSSLLLSLSPKENRDFKHTEKHSAKSQHKNNNDNQNNSNKNKNREPIRPKGSKKTDSARLIYILKAINKGMITNPQSVIHYDLTGRDEREYIGATNLREILLSDFNVQLTTYEIELLLHCFDPDGVGVTIVSILGRASNCEQYKKKFSYEYTKPTPTIHVSSPHKLVLISSKSFVTLVASPKYQQTRQASQTLNSASLNEKNSNLMESNDAVANNSIVSDFIPVTTQLISKRQPSSSIKRKKLKIEKNKQPIDENKSTIQKFKSNININNNISLNINNSNTYSDSTVSIILKLGKVAAHAIKTKKMNQFISMNAYRIRRKEFYDMLQEFDSQLQLFTKRDLRFIEEKYTIGCQFNDHSIDLNLFKKDFLLLGKETIKSKQNIEILHAFQQCMGIENPVDSNNMDTINTILATDMTKPINLSNACGDSYLLEEDFNNYSRSKLEWSSPRNSKNRNNSQEQSIVYIPSNDDNDHVMEDRDRTITTLPIVDFYHRKPNSTP